MPAKIGRFRGTLVCLRSETAVCVSLATLHRATANNSGETDRRQCPTEADGSESLNTTGSATGTAWRTCHREGHSHQAETALNEAVLLLLEGWVMRCCCCRHDCALNGRCEISIVTDGSQPTNTGGQAFPTVRSRRSQQSGRGAARSALDLDATPRAWGRDPGPVSYIVTTTEWC
jgi:hypothetical protein